jgi:hypothetical protein
VAGFDWNKLETVKPNSKPKAEGKSSFSWDELETVEQKPLEEPGVLSKIGQGVVEAGNFVDSYTGAPTRAAIGAMQDGKNPITAGWQQVGRDPKLAPSGQQIASKMGVQGETLVMPSQKRQAFDEKFNPGLAAAFKKSGKPYEDLVGNPSAAIGLGIDIAADPTNLIPGVAAAKGAGRLGMSAIGKTADVAGNLAAKAARTTKAGNAVVETAKATKEALEGVFRPKQASDFSKWIEIAQKNGIDPSALPESIEFGPGSVISRGARTVREGPIGQDAMEAFQDGLLQVDAAVDQKIAKIGGGLPLNDVEAGDLIRKGYDDAVEEMFNNVDFTYDRVVQQAPGARLVPAAEQAINSKLAGIEKFAKGRSVRGFTKTDREQGNQLLKAVAAARQANGSLKQLNELMGDVGRIAFKQGNTAMADVPPDIEKFRDLYFTLRDGFIETTAKTLGPDVANSLIDSNQQITMFLKNKEPIGKLLSNKMLAPEKLFKSLISSGDTTKIQALKDMITPEQFNQLKGSYLESLITRNSDETINFGALRTRLQKNRAILSVLFEPDEITEVAELVQLGEKFGPSVLSTSGTGGSGLFRNMLEGIKSGATNRTTLEYMKETARGRSQIPFRDPPQLTGRQQFSLPRRTSPEEVAKYLQISAASEGASNKDKEAAAQRRLETIKRLRGAGQ